MEEQNVKQSRKFLVLLIEDDTLLVNMYKSKFESEGFEILTSSDGEEGLRLAIEKKPDFIILDLMMPKLSGMELLEKLRADEWGKNVSVVVLTNLTQEKEAQKARELGVIEYLVKADLTPKDVVERVRKYLPS